MAPDMVFSNKYEYNYYVVIQGRVDKPTIYSSWAHAHPRVTGAVDAQFKGFFTFEEALEYLPTQHREDYVEALEGGRDKPVARRQPNKFWAVANGTRPGVYRTWENGAKQASQMSGSCYQGFGTREEAEQFIEDWKNACADVWRREIKRALDEGRRPENMGMHAKQILPVGGPVSGGVDDLAVRMCDLSVRKG